VIDEHLVAPYLGSTERADEEPVGDLDVRDRDPLFHLCEHPRVIDVPALDGDDLAFADPAASEQPFAFYPALADLNLR